MTADVLSTRALNRALLARQLLLRRAKRPVVDTIEHLAGMQAQEPNNPYVALWTRLGDFDPQELSELIANREVVRAALMRATLHAVSARDYLMLRPLMNPVLERTFRSGSPFGRRIADVDFDALLAAGRALVEERPLTTAQLRAGLAERWPEHDRESLARAIHYLVPVVQVPPRGLWGATGMPTWTTAEAWLGRPLDPEPSIDNAVLRYLAAFGPASAGDMRAWCGLTRLSEAFERVRPQLRTFRDERGRELFDLPDAPRPDPGVPAPPRFLPEYDNVFLGHADRTRIVAEEERRRLLVAAINAFQAPFLLDGFVAGTWRITRERRSATLLIQPFESLSKQDRTALTDEGRWLLAFVAADADSRDIRFADAD